MSSFKKLNLSDVFNLPFVANKEWNYSINSPTSSNNTTIYQGKNITGSFSLNGPTSSLGEYEHLIYTFANHMFYQRYSGSLNTGSLMKTLNNYESASSDRPTGSYFIYNENPAFVPLFPTGSNETIQMIAVDRNVFGAQILPTSLRLSSSYIATDDGKGNLISGSTQIGNVFYSHGIIIISHQSNQTITYPLNLQFKNEHTIYENYITCKVEESEFNLSYNPSLTDSSSSLYGYTSGSNFTPYVTTIGLYNDDNELLLVAKVSTPLPVSQKTDFNILIRYDT